MVAVEQIQQGGPRQLAGLVAWQNTHQFQRAREKQRINGLAQRIEDGGFIQRRRHNIPRTAAAARRS
jgi:hypothetical protein